MAASRSSRVTRSSVGINGLDENFCGRTLRNRSIAQPEESSPPPASRARSPKKKQDCQQHQQAGAQVGKVAESKAEGELLPAYGKRGLPSSEQDESEKSDNCERPRVGGGPEASPALKRAKRCSRSGELQGVEEEPPLKPDSPDPAAPKKNDEDLKSNPPSIPPLSIDKEAEQKEDGLAEKNVSPLQVRENVKATNGLSDLDKEDSEVAALPAEPCASPAMVNNSSSLLNGSQAVPSSPDPIVPCRSPHPKQANESDSPQIDCERNCTAEEAAEAVLSREPEMEVEVEVDVVGDSGQAQDELARDESTNGSFVTELQDPSDDCSNISGETVALASSQLPAEPPSFTEPQEHRYTLRTSPRRAACGSGPKASSPIPSSPHIDNSSLKEEATLVHVSSEDASHKDPIHESLGLSSEADSEFSDKAGVSEEVEVSHSRSSRSTKELLATQAEEDEEEEEDPDVYYFESDHLALKHNKDYRRLLQTISVLEAQRTQAIMDLETLARRQKEALTDPITFVDQLQKQVEMGLPRPQRVVKLPDIAWDQYTSGRGDFEREICDKKRKTRQLKLIFDKVGLPARPKSPVDSKKEGDSSSVYSSTLPSSDSPEQSMTSSTTQMIRGRLCNQSKPDSFNQLWTVEEQKKLEQLLLKFPPEEVETKRWQKIADELGNRTAKQVASRVQKYFIKLTKAGIPVPGRTPNVCMYSKKASSKRQHHLNKHLYRPSTFLTSYEPHVYMDEEDERSHFFNSLQDYCADDSDEDGVPEELRYLPEYKELLELKKLKKQKLQEIQAESALTQHIGYKCDMCGMEPIQGIRWHCQDCPQDNAVDFCSTCSDCLFKTETHKPTHRLEPVYQAETFLDKDYCLQQSTGYNYLDPNYFPANR
ncbi:ZZ-type zinc finger-containing protein 3 [Xyrauchen texanus]|uniref:ZZ-type zinc finger-containing protein 3 n=1 Tax=Xyrauchen texanus TaxID=154827 RepID=UPI0022426CDD|nr:ZZ-type zinc finger-containing protein 3 [Xyrauchen texanus]XP_051989227.1 ZZ-type zinc finger-containing protein 3 [Xyrauchen texanus]XP_051989228.1 ZZ-type zinc finger-containing protein 3 [Xyrauchen texanus]